MNLYDFTKSILTGLDECQIPSQNRLNNFMGIICYMYSRLNYWKINKEKTQK